MAVIPSGLPHSDLEDMNRRGIRGCRMSTVVSGGASFEHLEGLAGETFDFGWHLVLHFGKAIELVELAPAAARTPSPFVLDHSPDRWPRRRRLARVQDADAAARYRPLLGQACQPLSPVGRALSASRHAADDPQGRRFVLTESVGSNRPH